MSTSSNYYEVLGIAVDASSDEIKAAFKKLALQYHPDVYKGADAHERMRVILQAYQTLNDPAARRQYDIQHSKKTKSSSNIANLDSSPYDVSPSVYERSPSGTLKREAARTRAQNISAKARRDRQRYYDFPDCPPGKSVHVDLIDITYTFLPTQWSELVRYGMLRGNAPTAEKQIYFCHRCHYRWRKQGSTNNLPSSCPKCHSADWDEFLLLRCLHCCVVFESEQIRYEIGSRQYGGRAFGPNAGLCRPYELFPLCPYCGSARWSPAEDARISNQQLRRMRRSSGLRLVVICLALVLVAMVGAFMLGILH